ARVQQVLWNLVKNAIKFTSAGGTVSLTTWNRRDQFFLSCADDGIGIAGDVLPLIFEPFQQGGAEITRHYGGLGLGLAVSRSLIEAHGGSLTAESEGPGHGATFTVCLPHVVTRLVASESPSSAHEIDPDGERRARILLVEDHPDTARAVTESLKS